MKVVDAIILMLALSGCASIRFSYECDVPSFDIMPPSIVNESFPTSGYFKSSCKTETAKKFTIKAKLSGVSIDVHQEAFRPTIYMNPSATAGENIIIAGRGVYETSPVHSYAIDIDLFEQRTVSFELRHLDSEVIDTIVLEYSPVTCNCVGYDGP